MDPRGGVLQGTGLMESTEAALGGTTSTTATEPWLTLAVSPC